MLPINKCIDSPAVVCTVCLATLPLTTVGLTGEAINSTCHVLPPLVTSFTKKMPWQGRFHFISTLLALHCFHVTAAFPLHCKCGIAFVRGNLATEIVRLIASSFGPLIRYIGTLHPSSLFTSLSFCQNSCGKIIKLQLHHLFCL